MNNEKLYKLLIKDIQTPIDPKFAQIAEIKESLILVDFIKYKTFHSIHCVAGNYDDFIRQIDRKRLKLTSDKIMMIIDVSIYENYQDFIKEDVKNMSVWTDELQISNIFECWLVTQID